MCVWGGGVYVVWWEGGRRKDITESYGGEFIILKNQNPPFPNPLPQANPLPQVMNNDQPPFIYSYIFFYSFILFIYLFILFVITFSPKGKYQKELFYLTYLGSVPINLYLAFIWMRFGILLYREVRKKWFPS